MALLLMVLHRRSASLRLQTLAVTIVFASILLLSATAAPPGKDLIIEDFEGPGYGAWKVEGDAFGPEPAKGTLPGQMKVEGFRGRALANSFRGGDRSTGTVTSPVFEIARSNINFLIGGGGYTNETLMELLVDGKVVRTATGTNVAPGGSENLQWQSWELSDLPGRQATIRIVDQRRGGWGHINIDHIIQSDFKPPRLLQHVKRDFHVTKNYLNFPIRNGAPRKSVTVLADGKQEVVNTIELADSTPDWWAPMDARAWRGKEVSLVVDSLSEDSEALSLIDQSDAFKDAENLYREPLRPQFHFSSRHGWLNDPNGLTFFHGEYHLFYQHNPYGVNWGNMHWGHAVSKDLVHWRELGDALAPDNFGPMYSGSAVVNTWEKGSFGMPGRSPEMALIYTAAGKPTVQCLATSTDGRTFAKYTSNPILKQITQGNRDPKVIWHEPTGKWIMVLYVGLPEKKHTIQFFASKDLRGWTHVSTVDGGSQGDSYLYECPDLFELPLDGDMARRCWVLTAADGRYAVGDFDGREFKPLAERLEGPHGKVFYAAQTFSAEPKGRRVQIGWLRAPSPGVPFNQCMSIPQELTLVSTSQGPRLKRMPVAELQLLRTRTTRNPGSVTIHPGEDDLLMAGGAELVELSAEFEPAKARTRFGIRGAQIIYDGLAQQLEVEGLKVPAPVSKAGTQSITVYCDRTTLEVFASDGLCYVPVAFRAAPENLRLEVSVEKQAVAFSRLDVHELQSAWLPEVTPLPKAQN